MPKPALAVRHSLHPCKEQLGSTLITGKVLRELCSWDYRSSTQKVAIATLVTSSFYVPGALTLMKSFQNAAKDDLVAHFGYDCLCLVTDKVPEQDVLYLKHAGWTMRQVRQMPVDGCSSSDLVSEHFMECYNKIWLWSMEEYAGILYIDSDAIITRPISHIFRALSFSLIGFAAAPDWDLDNRAFYKDYFNAGVLAIRPCHAVFQDMCQRLLHHKPVNGFAEQDFLNDYYARDVYQIWQKLQFVYVDSPHVWSSIYPSICIIHYPHKKPWKLINSAKCLHVGLSYEPDERRSSCENARCWILNDYWHIVRAMPQDPKSFPQPPLAVPDNYNPLTQYKRLDQILEEHVKNLQGSQTPNHSSSIMKVSDRYLQEMIWHLYRTKLGEVLFYSAASVRTPMVRQISNKNSLTVGQTYQSQQS
eukprot:jgi/Galph1/755/GphlegSOOS_G5474.1